MADSVAFVEAATVPGDLKVESVVEVLPVKEEEVVEQNSPAEKGVDWETLGKSEEHEQNEQHTDKPIDSGFLRHRLQRENSFQETHTRRQSSTSSHPSRRGSLQQIRRSVVDSATHGSPTIPRKSTLGHCRQESKEILLTDLELWTALVSDYTQTAIRLPILTSRKIRAGIPQPLRGLVWQAMSGARDTHLEGLYDTLSVESTPFEKVIGRDLARTFPQVEMFKEEGGAGQLDLGKVLRAFSLYDADVGYCQGLGFLVAPLLMNMAHSEAFCVLVRMMEGYGLRSMYTPTLTGLKLRLSQFEHYLELLAPSLAAHLSELGISTAMYASQWFLSLFAVTCPLETLHRLYDVMLAEGIPETMMRTALTLLVKNEGVIMTLDMEGILRLLLSSELWTAYGMEDDLLISDIVSFTTDITTDGMLELEKQYESVPQEPNTFQFKGLQSVASNFLGSINPTRLFSGTFSTPGKTSVSMSRTPSKVSTHSVNSSASSSTEAVEESTNSSFSRSSITSLKKQTETLEKENRQLNQQVEDLIEAMSESHREVVVLKEQGSKYQATLDDFKAVAIELLTSLKPLQKVQEEKEADSVLAHWTTELNGRLTQDPMSPPAQLSLEKIKFLESQLDDRNHEVGRMRLSLQSVKAALDATQKDKVKIEKALNEVRLRKDKATAPNTESGMRELKLGRTNTTTSSRASSQTRAPDAAAAAASTGGSAPNKLFRRASTFSNMVSNRPDSPDLLRSATTSPSPVLSSTPLSPTLDMTAHEEEMDALRLELVQAKAAIAISQQEAEEAKYALRMAKTLATTQQQQAAVAAQQQQQTLGHAKRISMSRAETAPATATEIKIATNTTAENTATSGWFWRR